MKDKKGTELQYVNIPIGDNELQINSENQIKLECKQPSDWADAILLLQHEPIRYELNFLKIIYTHECIMNPKTRKLLAKWFREHISFVIDRHEHLEELVWKKIQRQTNMEVTQSFTGMSLHLDHIELETILDDMYSHLLDLSTKELVTENDIQLTKVENFIEIILNHLKQEEEGVPPQLRNCYSNDKGYRLLKSIFKAQEDEIKVLMPWFMNQITKWAPLQFQQLLNDKLLPHKIKEQYPEWQKEYQDQNKEFADAMGEFSEMWTDTEVNQLLLESPQLTKRQSQGISQMSEPELIRAMYKALRVDVSVLQIEVVIKAAKYSGIKNLAFFFAKLTLFEEILILLTFLEFGGNDTEEYDKLKIEINNQDYQIENNGKNASQRLFALSKETKNEVVALKLKNYAKKYYKQVKVEENKCDYYFGKMERFRVEGVDDTFYGVFLALYLANVLGEMQTPIRIGSGLTALYLLLVNLKGIKQLILSIPALFVLEKWKFFCHSMRSWTGWQEIQLRKLIEDLAFLGMDLTFLLKALDQIGDKFLVMSSIITQGMMVLAAIYTIMEHLINIRKFQFQIKSIEYLNYARAQLPEKAQTYCLSRQETWQLKQNMVSQILTTQKLIKIMALFALFEFGLVVFSVIAICNIDLKSTIIEYYGPTLTAILVLSSQIYKQVVDSKDKTPDIKGAQETLFSKVLGQ